MVHYNCNFALNKCIFLMRRTNLTRESLYPFKRAMSAYDPGDFATMIRSI